MSVEALAVVLHHSKAKATDKLVLLGIANHLGDGGAWPTIETLARYANVHERTVQASIVKLTRLGELAVHRQAGGRIDTPSWARPNRYDVTVTCPMWCDHTLNHRPRQGYPQENPQPATLPGMSESDRVTPTPPGDAHATGGVVPTPPEPDTNHNHVTLSGSVTGPRASDVTVPDPEQRHRYVDEARRAMRDSQSTTHPTTDDETTTDTDDQETSA